MATTEFRLGIDGVAAFEFSDGTTKNVDLANLGAGGAGTNLTVTQNGTTVTVNSDTGTDATIPAATGTTAGVMSSAQVTALAGKQDAIAAGTNKILAAPAVAGGAPVQITLGTNLSISGGTLNATGSGGGAVNVQAGPLVASATDAPNATAVIDALATKAAAITAASTVTSGTVLTRVAGTGAPTGHYNRPLDCAGGTLTCGGAPALNDVASVLNTHASIALTLTGSGVTVTAAAGKIAELVYNGAVWVDPSSAVASSAAQRLTPTTPLPILDAASGSTAETVVLEGLLPALSAGSQFTIDFAFNTPTAGSGTAVYRLRLGGAIAGGLSDTVTLDISPHLQECGRWRLWFVNGATASKQIGGPLASAVYGAGSKAAGMYESSVNTGAATRWVLTVTKAVAGDVKNIVAATPLVVL